MEQPKTGRYGVSALYLFEQLDRDKYKARFGVQAPPFDPKRPAKCWLDSSATVGRKDGSLIEYTVFENNAFTPLTLTAGEAATVNLTGRYEYAPYAPAATVAITFNGVGINPRALISAADAQAIVDELTAAGAHVLSIKADTSIQTNWGTETRRQYEITFADGVVCDAAGLMAAKCIAGVGAPGHWVVIPGSEPIWVVEAQDDGGKAGAAVPVPVRQLLSNERLVIGWAGLASIERTDLAADGEPTTAVTGLTTEQAAELAVIATTVATVSDKVDKLTTSIDKIVAALRIK